jgi:hypothetical protein
MRGSVYSNRHSRVLALLLAEAGFEVYLFVQRLLLNKPLECLNDMIRTFNMAGTADTYA